jgi:hypothetical protein
MLVLSCLGCVLMGEPALTSVVALFVLVVGLPPGARYLESL